MTPDPDRDVFVAVVRDPAVRRETARRSHLMFFHLYLHHYVKYGIADFQKEIFKITEDAKNHLACIVAFRGSGKSTLITLSYAIWAILGIQQKKFVLIICETQPQARQHMANLRYELEHNALLRSDLGPFREDPGDGQWAMSSLVFKNTNARIMIASVDQRIRGIRHREYRPDLLILDDIEDMNATRTLENRDKTAEWFTREVIPLGDVGTRTLIVANLIHEDSLVARLKKKIETGEMSGIYRWFPLVDEKGECSWPSKFDTPNKIEDLRKKVGDERSWRREYLLEMVSEEDRVICPEWIQYDTALPKTCGYIAVGIDVAISEKESADYTAMVAGMVSGSGKDLTIHILPNPINKRMSFLETADTAETLSRTLGDSKLAELFVEDVAYQKALIETLRERQLPVEGVKVYGEDKRARFAAISHLIQSGRIVFQQKGNEELISQMLNFGSAKHDDLVDALTTLVRKAVEKGRSGSGMIEIVSSDLYQMRRGPGTVKPRGIADWVFAARRGGFH